MFAKFKTKIKAAAGKGDGLEPESEEFQALVDGLKKVGSSPSLHSFVLPYFSLLSSCTHVFVLPFIHSFIHPFFYAFIDSFTH